MSRSRLYGIASTVALGGFLVGFDATVISGAVPFLRDLFLPGRNVRQPQAWLGRELSRLGCDGRESLRRKVERPLRPQKRAAADRGAMFSHLLWQRPLPPSFAVFVAARICGGLAVGAAILTAPVYIAEIAPARSRGSLVSLNQLMIVIGISVSFFSNYFLLTLGAVELALDARCAGNTGCRAIFFCCCSCPRVRDGC